MYHKLFKEKIYCGLDIGSQTLKGAVIKVNHVDDIELLGVYVNKTYGFKDCPGCFW